MVQKAFKTRKTQIGKKKPIKAKKEKKRKPLGINTVIFNTIAETLQANSDGEFDLPSDLVRYMDRKHTRFKYGLHREFYVPEGKVIPYYNRDDPKAMNLYRNHSSMIMSALGEGIKIREHNFDPPFCEDCNG